jgi:hypothetical protein
LLDSCENAMKKVSKKLTEYFHPTIPYCCHHQPSLSSRIFFSSS